MSTTEDREVARTDPVEEKVQKEPEGSEATQEDEGFLSMRFQRLEVSAACSPSAPVTTRLPEARLATIRRRGGGRAGARRAGLGGSLTRLQRKTSSSELSSSIQAAAAPGSAKVFGRKFSASLDSFAGLSLGEAATTGPEVEVGAGESGFRAAGQGCKRKRLESPVQEEAPLPCGQQARRGLEDVNAEDLAGQRGLGLLVIGSGLIATLLLTS
jgi:hypothetical protein